MPPRKHPQPSVATGPRIAAIDADPEPRPSLGPPVPRRPDSVDPVLLEFWSAADLDPSALTTLDRHIRLAGEWQHDHVPRSTDWNLDPWDRIHDDSDSIAIQVSRFDLASDSRDVVLTLNTSPVDWPWVEVAVPDSIGGLPGPNIAVRPSFDLARISTRTPTRTTDILEAILRARRTRRGRFFTCRLCGARRPPEGRCVEGAGHCCCDRLRVIH